jgi:hypothetical protein
VNLYLDIDGVLLTKRGALAEGAGTFLRWAVERHEPAWISTRTRDGSIRGALRAFHGLLEPSLIEAVQVARWHTLKTEALPLAARDWLWIDDEILQTERAALADAGALDRFIRIDVNRNPHALVSLRHFTGFV